MKDGLILMYVKNDVIYPVAMSNEEYQTLQLIAGSLMNGKITVIDKPQGTAVNLKNTKEGMESCL